MYGFARETRLNDKIYRRTGSVSSVTVRSVCKVLHGPYVRISCALAVYRRFSAIVGEREAALLSLGRVRATETFRRGNLAQHLRAASCTKITICLEFRDGRLRSRERDTLKLSGHAGDDKFRGLREYKRSANCSNVLLKKKKKS